VTNSGIVDTKLEQFFESANNSSKIVDENGEPKVVYPLMSMMQAANLPQRTRLNLQMSQMKQMQ
jgi:hypothetical protein